MNNYITGATTAVITPFKNPANTTPLIPVGRKSLSTMGITFSGSVTLAIPVSASREMPIAIAQRTIRKKLQEAPTLAASIGFRVARKI